MTRHRTREAWLNAVVQALRPSFRSRGYTIPRRVAVTMGFPSTGATSKRDMAVAQCWSPDCSPDGTTHIFVSPVLAEEQAVAGYLVHELIHAALGPAVDHREVAFKQAYADFGMIGRMVAARPGKALRKEIASAIKPLGLYPHAGFKP